MYHGVYPARACRIPDTAAKLNIGTLALAVMANMRAPTRVYATDSSQHDKVKSDVQWAYCNANTHATTHATHIFNI